MKNRSIRFLQTGSKNMTIHLPVRVRVDFICIIASHLVYYSLFHSKKKPTKRCFIKNTHISVCFGKLRYYSDLVNVSSIS